MKTTIFCFLPLVAVGLAGLSCKAVVTPAQGPDTQKATARLSAELRMRVLSREIFKTPTAGISENQDVRAAVMEWRLSWTVATFVAYYDGSVSLYYSAGGGSLGLGEMEDIRQAGIHFLDTAANFRQHFAATESFPFPGKEEMTFYLVTSSSTLSSGPIPIEDLRSYRHPLHPVEFAAQEMITRIVHYWEANEGREGKADDPGVNATPVGEAKPP